MVLDQEWLQGEAENFLQEEGQKDVKEYLHNIKK